MKLALIIAAILALLYVQVTRYTDCRVTRTIPSYTVCTDKITGRETVRW